MWELNGGTRHEDFEDFRDVCSFFFHRKRKCHSQTKAVLLVLPFTAATHILSFIVSSLLFVIHTIGEKCGRKSNPKETIQNLNAVSSAFGVIFTTILAYFGWIWGEFLVKTSLLCYLVLNQRLYSALLFRRSFRDFLLSILFFDVFSCSLIEIKNKKREKEDKGAEPCAIENQLPQEPGTSNETNSETETIQDEILIQVKSEWSDVCFDITDSPGTITWRTVIQRAADNFVSRAYSVRIHFWIMHELGKRTFYIDGESRESMLPATHEDIWNRCKECFENEKRKRLNEKEDSQSEKDHFLLEQDSKLAPEAIEEIHEEVKAQSTLEQIEAEAIAIPLNYSYEDGQLIQDLSASVSISISLSDEGDLESQQCSSIDLNPEGTFPEYSSNVSSHEASTSYNTYSYEYQSQSTFSTKHTEEPSTIHPESTLESTFFDSVPSVYHGFPPSLTGYDFKINDGHEAPITAIELTAESTGGSDEEIYDPVYSTLHSMTQNSTLSEGDTVSFETLMKGADSPGFTKSFHNKEGDDLTEALSSQLPKKVNKKVCWHPATLSNADSFSISAPAEENFLNEPTYSVEDHSIPGEVPKVPLPSSQRSSSSSLEVVANDANEQLLAENAILTELKAIKRKIEKAYFKAIRQRAPKEETENAESPDVIIDVEFGGGMFSDATSTRNFGVKAVEIVSSSTPSTTDQPFDSSTNIPVVNWHSKVSGNAFQQTLKE